MFNPYWQILENSSRNFSKILIFWVVRQAVLLENSSSFFFRNLNSGASHRPFYWKTHPLKIMDTYSVFLILGRHTGRFTGKFIHSNFDWNLISYKLQDMQLDLTICNIFNNNNVIAFHILGNHDCMVLQTCFICNLLSIIEFFFAKKRFEKWSG